MILDLTRPEQWMPVAEQVVLSTFTGSDIAEISKHSPDEMFSDTLDYIHEVAYTNDDQLNYQLREKFESRFSEIRVFHSCRIDDESSYSKKGILRITDDLLLSLALERLRGHATPTDIKQACSQFHLDSHDRKVYFFLSFEEATADHQNHYLMCGAESLQALTSYLGLSSKGILLSQGSSCVIECVIPIRCVEVIFRDCIWRDLITMHFKELTGEKYIGGADDGGVAVESNISPSCIVKFHYVKLSERDYLHPKH